MPQGKELAALLDVSEDKTMRAKLELCKDLETSIA